LGIGVGLNYLKLSKKTFKPSFQLGQRP